MQILRVDRQRALEFAHRCVDVVLGSDGEQSVHVEERGVAGRQPQRPGPEAHRGARISHEDRVIAEHLQRLDVIGRLRHSGIERLMRSCLLVGAQLRIHHLGGAVEPMRLDAQSSLQRRDLRAPLAEVAVEVGHLTLRLRAQKARRMPGDQRIRASDLVL